MTTKKGERLTEKEESFFRKAMCPDCYKMELKQGPSGGMSINYRCGSEACGSQFNDAMAFVERISDAGMPPDPKRGGVYRS